MLCVFHSKIMLLCRPTIKGAVTALSSTKRCAKYLYSAYRAASYRAACARYLAQSGGSSCLGVRSVSAHCGCIGKGRDKVITEYRWAHSVVHLSLITAL